MYYRTNFSPQTKCCGYGNTGMATATGYDCALIPGALKNTANSAAIPENICGRGAGLVTANGMTAATVCSELPTSKTNWVPKL